MKGTCRKTKWIERNMNRIKRILQGIAWKHTRTDKRKVKGTMTVMEAKRKGNKQCKENDRERKEREKDIKTSYLHGKWNDMVRVGRSHMITYDGHTSVMSPRPFCYFIMKIVTGNEKRMTRVRLCPIHSNIERVAKPYKFMSWSL